MNASKSILSVLAVLVVFLSGCRSGWDLTDGISVTNLTADHLPENPSSLYRVSILIKRYNADVDRASLKPKIVIGGNTYPMVQSPFDPDVFEYDYKMPLGQNQARYYFLVDYGVRYGKTGSSGSRQVSTGLFSVSLLNRYIISLSASRGPAGSEIFVLGRGFNLNDRISIGNSSLQTKFHSSTSMSFVVPPLPEGKAYPIRVLGAAGELDVGDFLVDASQLRVVPNRLDLNLSEEAILTFSIDSPAPAGGLALSVLTDIPSGFALEDVFIPGGQRSVSVRIVAQRLSKGVLVVKSPGFSKLVVPVSIIDPTARPSGKDGNLKAPGGIDSKIAPGINRPLKGQKDSIDILEE